MQVTKIQVGRDVLVLGDADTLQGLPRELRRRSAVCGVLRRMMTDAHAMRQLRHYWGARSLGLPDGRRTDYELIEVVEAAIETGVVPAMVIPDHGPGVRDLEAAVPAIVARRPDTIRPVAQMTAEERVWEVVKRAAGRLPRATGNALLAMFTPENITIAAGLAALSAAANLTPLGWAADAVLLGVAIGFGGVAALQGVKDLVACLALTVNATRDADLDEAAEHLARVVADFGVMWLMALLHERARRGTGGGEGVVDETPLRDQRGIKRRRSPDGTEGDAETPPAKRGRSDEPGSGASEGESQSGKAGPAKKPSPGGKKAGKRKKDKRRQYLGDTPGKSSRTGREVRERMRLDGDLRTDPETGQDMFRADDENWYPVDSPQTHMGHHPQDAVDWWNSVGREYGAKSPEVRAWMLDSKNYRFEYGPENSGRGGSSRSRYLPPLK